MPKTDPQAHISTDTVRTAMEIAKTRGPLDFALLAWMYEFGARVTEPGLQLLRDVDLRMRVARPVHLKGGTAKAAQPLLRFCCAALPSWLAVRQEHVTMHEQNAYLFPSRRPGRCYTCKGTGQRTVLRRVGTKRMDGMKVPCHHCNATGKRWGMDRAEIYPIVRGVLEAAGCAPGYRHPHVLRHSIITHLLDANTPPHVVQARVGHADIKTTVGYAVLTDKARQALETALDDMYED